MSPSRLYFLIGHEVLGILSLSLTISAFVLGAVDSLWFINTENMDEFNFEKLWATLWTCCYKNETQEEKCSDDFDFVFHISTWVSVLFLKFIP